MADLTKRLAITTLFVSFVIATLCATPSQAQGPVTGSGAWYYEIGGAEPVSPAPNANVTPITISGSASLSMPRACSSLDPVLAVSNILDDVAHAVDQFEDSMVLAANSAIAALPALILQRANPGLYDHFQNAMLNATARINVAVKSCEEMVEDGRNGENPFKDWVYISRGHTWHGQLEMAGNDPVTARQAVDTANGNAGVPWLGGDRGGASQPPIEVIKDTVHAGYNVTLNRAPTATGAPTASPTPPRLVELWPTPEDASAWAQEVLGDRLIRTCEGCIPESVAGTGLIPKYESERDTVATELSSIVSGSTDPTIQNLRDVSAPQVIVTRQLVDAIRTLDDTQETTLTIKRLAADVATARTVERALTIRRLILSGKSVPEIETKEPALDAVEDVVSIVEREIDNFLYEDRIRKELISGTARTILARAQRLDTRSLDLPTAIEQDPDQLIKGKVNP